MTGKRIYDRKKLVPLICERLAKGEPLTLICRDVGVTRRQVNNWRKEDQEIAGQFDDARDAGFDAIATEALRIADTPALGEEVLTFPDGKQQVKSGDMLGHRKLQVWTRMQLLAKWDRRYRPSQGGGGPDDDEVPPLHDPNPDV